MRTCSPRSAATATCSKASRSDSAAELDQAHQRVTEQGSSEVVDLAERR